jgi:acyl-CoA thioesterase-1
VFDEGGENPMSTKGSPRVIVSPVAGNARRLPRGGRQRGVLDVMASPPTITYGAANAGSSLDGTHTSHVYAYPLLTGIGTAAAVPLRTGPIRLSGFPVVAAGITSPDWNYLKADRGYLTGSATGEPPYVLEFDLYGDAFEFGVKGLTGLNFQLWVDDQPIALTTLIPGTGNVPNSGSNHRVIVTFSAVGHYRIRIEAGIVCRIGGIDVAANHSILPPTTAAPLYRAAFLGDSYSGPGGTSMQSGPASWCFEAARICGWDPVVSSVGGTGYLADNSGSGVPFGSRVVNDILSLDPDIVVVQGGYNDRAFTPGQITTAARSLYSAILAGRPGATLYVVGIHHPGAPDATCLAINVALKALCASMSIPYCDMSLVFNRGWTALFNSGDAIHPNDAGQRHFGRYAGGQLLALQDV